MDGPNKNDEEEVFAKYELLSPDQVPKDSFSEWFQDQVNRESAQINLSDADPRTIVSLALTASATLDGLCNKVLPDLPEIVAAIRHDDEATRRLNETVLKAVDFACYLLAVLREANKTIFKQLRKNGTNRNFAFLLLAAKCGNYEMYRDAQDQLLRIALSIPLQDRRWFHPKGPKAWRDPAISVLNKEEAKHQQLDVSGVLERMMGNQFAYIYSAFRREFIDEMRSMKRRKERYIYESDLEVIGQGSQEIELVEDEQHCQSLVTFVRQLLESPELPPGPRFFVYQLLIYLTEPSKWADLGLGDPVREVAKAAGVTKQQARNYRLQLESLAKQDSEIGHKLGELREQVLKLRFREKDSAER